MQHSSFTMSATINSLAPETLREIFLYAFLSQAVEDWCTSTLPALLLVSPRWQTIIEEYPSLWTSLLVTEKSAHLPDQPLFHSINLRLPRSLHLPLSIIIKLPAQINLNVFGRRKAENLGKVIKGVAPRLESLEIRSESRVLQMAVLCQLGETPMPLLRSFTHVGCEDPDIGVRKGYHGPSYFEVIRGWRPSVLQHVSQQNPGNREMLNDWGREVYPVLENIEIVGAHYRWNCLPIMHSIRRISLRGQPEGCQIFVKEFLTMLEPISQTLEVLELVDVIKSELDDDDLLDMTIMFYSLEVVSLGYDHMSVADNFFLSICLPALKELTLTHTYEGRGTYKPMDPHHLVILSLIQMAPLWQVERLTLNGVVFPNEVLERVIPASWDGDL